jgi:branched-chain amino acid transport system substrate-binding protein
MKFTSTPLASRLFEVTVGAAIVVTATAAMGQAKSAKPLDGQVVKMAWIDPLSGLMAPVGNNQLKSWQYMIEKFNQNNPAGVKFEVIGLDNKLSPTESLNALKSATDQGIRYIIQGNGSSVALALVDAVNKYNERNPGKEVIFLNEAAVDPDLTNSKCSFWHFRFDADTTMKMEAMTTFMKDQKDIKKVYLLNQNYSHGQQVAKYGKEYLKRKRPDIEIVGEDLHPLAQVRDFAPYIAKIKASGADFGDHRQLGLPTSRCWSRRRARAATRASSSPTTPVSPARRRLLAPTAAGKVYQVAYSHYNMGGENDNGHGPASRPSTTTTTTPARSPGSWKCCPRPWRRASRSTPVKVAFRDGRPEGQESRFGGEVEMRKSDHQLQQPLYMTVWQKSDGKYSTAPRTPA